MRRGITSRFIKKGFSGSNTVNRRADLLELTLNALAALANVGFVKRAQKDLAAGRAPALAVADDGAVEARFDDEGVVTRLPPGRTLRDAACNCSASGMCRHRVMLVLAYQARFGADTDAAPPSAASPDWSPADFDDEALAASLAPSVLAQAGELAKAHPVVDVHAAEGNTPPLARLPMASVIFYARNALAHARCDCAQGGGCAHVALAVWAFRQARVRDPGLRQATIAVQPPQGTRAAAPTQGERARALIARSEEMLLDVWRNGAAQPLLALDARLQGIRAEAQALDWCWMDDAFDELEQLLHALHARSTRFEPRRLLAAVAEAWARLAAARHADAEDSPRLPANRILGLGIKGETPLDRLRLVSLGARLWADETSSEAACEGAEIVFADPDTQTVMVLQRQWPLSGAPSARTRRVAGAPLHQLAAGQVLTASALRRANGVLDIGGTARKTGVLPLSPTAWDRLAEPLRQRGIAALTRHLATLPPDFVQPRHSAGAVRILASDALTVTGWYWDAAAQILHADLEEKSIDEAGTGDEPGGPALHLALPHRAATPHAVDTLARALLGEWGELRAVAGPVRLVAGKATMLPLALLTEQRAVALQVEAAPPQPVALPQGAAAETQGWRALAGDTLQWLTHLLRQGLRHQAGDMAKQIQERSERLAAAGLRHMARLLRDAGERWQQAAQGKALETLSTLALLAMELERGSEAFRSMTDQEASQNPCDTVLREEPSV
jgi:hypothetical protein